MDAIYTVCLSCDKVNRVPAQPGKTPVCGSCKTELPLHDGVSELSAGALSTLLKKCPTPVVVDFWAPWCGPCRAFAPTFIQAASQLAGQVTFVKLNTEAHPLASDLHRIRSIPTLILFRGGIETNRVSGALPLPSLLQWLSATSPT